MKGALIIWMGEEQAKVTETIIGRLVRQRMRDFQSGFTIFDLRSGAKTYTCKGCVLRPSIGLLLEVTGTWKETSYGIQLVDCEVKELTNDLRSITEYLQTIPGVGPRTSESIAATFGESFYAAVDRPDAIDVLSKVQGMTPDRAKEIIKHIRATSQQRKLWEMFSKYEGATFSAMTKIFKAYGDEALEQFKADPYIVGGHAGLPFSVCDEIAKNEGIKTSDKARTGAAVRTALQSAASAGHTFVPYAELMESCKKLLYGKISAYDDGVAVPVIDLSMDANTRATVSRERDDCYLRHLLNAERNTANYINKLMSKAKKTEGNIDALCKLAEKVCKVKYEQQQKEAFKLLLHGGVGIITGGPGTGKTTVIKGLLAAFDAMYPNGTVKLAAPTGRASQRMKEATGKEATTIHRLLEFKPFNGALGHKGPNDPIDADALIVDEGSMLTIELAEILFSAVKPGTLVIVVGDIDQLPAVGAGNVLHDMIHCGTIPVVALTKTHRQAENSTIIRNAEKISEGRDQLYNAPDFEIIKADDTSIADIVVKKFMEYYDPQDVFSSQVLCPMRKKANGSTTNSNYLNEALQTAINGDGTGLRFGGTVFREGDKVMLMRNNYDVGYFNGDIGVITEVTDRSVIVKVETEEIELEEDLLEDLSLSYSTTIHKSQGSEYDTAIVVMPSNPKNMLQRNLLYTAVTRAKKKVVLIAAPGSVGTAVSRKDAAKRNSNLIKRLRGEVS